MKLEKRNQTRTQQNALHLWAEQWAEMLNAEGHTVRATLRDDWDTIWSKELFKELVIKKLAKAMYGKKSTTQLTSKDIDQIFDVVTKNLSEYGFVPFPSEEDVKNYENL
jgi:hypothetical protein